MEECEQYVIDEATKLRKQHRLTQKQFGLILDVSGSFVGNVENKQSSAKYNLKHIVLLIKYFKLSPSYFFE